MVALIRSLSRNVTSAPWFAAERHEKTRARIDVEALEGERMLSALGIDRNGGEVDARLLEHPLAMITTGPAIVARRFKTAWTPDVHFARDLFASRGDHAN